MTLELNEYIDKFSEIKPHIDQALESWNTHRDGITLNNNGCSNRVVNQCVNYIKAHGVLVMVESSSVSALNRLYGVQS